jgi:two-component system, sensor histidine kinase and response regulator
MKPTLASSGAEGLSALEQGNSTARFALVLLDVHMPDMDGFTVAQRIRSTQKRHGAKVILLTSAGRADDAARCRELGISGYLTKPIKQSELFDAIVTAMAEQAPRQERTGRRAASLKPSGRTLRVLLAEDNPVNQTLATRILEKLGHQVQVANNGKEALERAKAGEFDLIVMDVQMPEMDGLEATAAIRAAEAGTGKHVRIVAMTAHAMKGDRERCLNAGMDGYLSKPIRIDELKQAISEIEEAPKTVKRRAEEHHTFQAIGSLELLLDGVMGDRTLLAEMAELWLDDSERQMKQIETGLEQSDAIMIQRAAHALKGSVGTFQASGAQDASKKLETFAKDADMDGARMAFTALSNQIQLVRQDLRRLSQDLRPTEEERKRPKSRSA